MSTVFRGSERNFAHTSAMRPGSLSHRQAQQFGEGNGAHVLRMSRYGECVTEETSIIETRQVSTIRISMNMMSLICRPTRKYRATHISRLLLTKPISVIW